jgi:hypothetical protein
VVDRCAIQDPVGVDPMSTLVRAPMQAAMAAVVVIHAHGPVIIAAVQKGSTIFIDADGHMYEVMGEAGHSFNLVSTPLFSVNADFQAVPANFRYAGLPDNVGDPFNIRNLSDTVLGSMHVAVRLPDEHVFGLHVAVESGEKRCDADGRVVDCNLTLAAVEFSEETMVCSLLGSGQ